MDSYMFWSKMQLIKSNHIPWNRFRSKLKPLGGLDTTSSDTQFDITDVFAGTGCLPPRGRARCEIKHIYLIYTE